MRIKYYMIDVYELKNLLLIDRSEKCVTGLKTFANVLYIDIRKLPNHL